MSLEPIFVVMVNWNLKEYTVACVESIVTAGIPLEQIVIVDNGSTDGSIDTFNTRFPSLTQICLGENKGFTGGMNVGIRHALEQGAASVLLLNNDTVLDPGMIDAFLAADSQLDNPGILAPAIYYYDDPERVWRLGEIRYRWLPMPVTVRRSYQSLSTAEPFQIDYATGCAMLIRRQVLEQVGAFDERYFIYYDDADLSRRALDAGYTVWCVPQAKMWHKVSLTMIKQKPGMRYTEWWGRARFYRTHPHGFSRGLTHAYLLAKVVKKTVHDLLARDWELMQALWAGTRDGYLGRPSRHADFFS